jgi:hypothetical protein
LFRRLEQANPDELALARRRRTTRSAQIEIAQAYPFPVTPGRDDRQSILLLPSLLPETWSEMRRAIKG